jgi:dipeptidyl aminopeptidase/acylaminoacyl peptidase
MLSFLEPRDLKVSPDGKFTAFVVVKPDFEKSNYQRDIWIVDNETKKLRKFLQSENSETKPLWSPDGKYLAFLSKPYDEKKEESEKNQVWIIPSDGGGPWKLTSADQGIIDYQWFPDGKSVLYLTREALTPEKKELKQKDEKSKFDFTVEEKERYKKEFWKVDLEKKSSQKIFQGDYGISEFELSPDGKRIVFSTNYSGLENDYARFDLWILSVGSKEAMQLTSRYGSEENPVWAEDGEKILFLAPLDSSLSFSQKELFVIQASGGKPVNLTQDFDFVIDRIKSDPKGKYIYFIAEVGMQNQIYRISLNKGEIERVTDDLSSYYYFDLYENGMVFVGEDSVSTPEIFKSDPKGKKTSKLTDLNPSLKKFHINSQEVISWRSFDGWEIEGLLIKPYYFDSEKKYPMIVHVHGGPFGRTQNIFLYPKFQTLASEGYVVFAPNFRGSSGYSEKFGTANRTDLGGGDFLDIMSGIDHILSLGFVDFEGLGITGGSYGGFMTNWAITQTDRFKAAVSRYGIFNLFSDYGNTYIPYWDWEYLKGYYWENDTFYVRCSPSTYVENVKTPTLIMHGDEDPNCFISSSKELYRALKDLGVEVEFVHYPREPHGFYEPNHRVDAMNRELNWFDKYLKKDPQYPGIKVTVEKNGWKLTVEDLKILDSYLGKKATGKFLEVKLRLKGDTREEFELNLNNDIRLITPDYDQYIISGIPLRVSENNTVILKGENQVIKISKDDLIKPISIELKIVFDLDKELNQVFIKVKDFPKIFLSF